MKLSAQMEDYLEIIALLCRENGVARVKDIARRMAVTNPSVVGAIRTLKAKALVTQERYGFVRLTEPGEALARSVLDRHMALADFLENVLGLAPDIASTDACRIEHVASAETIQRLRSAAEFVKSKTHEDLNWSKEFNAFCKAKNKRNDP